MAPADPVHLRGNLVSVAGKASGRGMHSRVLEAPAIDHQMRSSLGVEKFSTGYGGRRRPLTLLHALEALLRGAHDDQAVLTPRHVCQ